MCSLVKGGWFCLVRWVALLRVFSQLVMLWGGLWCGYLRVWVGVGLSRCVLLGVVLALTRKHG